MSSTAWKSSSAWPMVSAKRRHATAKGRMTFIYPVAVASAGTLEARRRGFAHLRRRQELHDARRDRHAAEHPTAKGRMKVISPVPVACGRTCEALRAAPAASEQGASEPQASRSKTPRRNPTTRTISSSWREGRARRPSIWEAGRSRAISSWPRSIGTAHCAGARASINRSSAAVVDECRGVTRGRHRDGVHVSGTAHHCWYHVGLRLGRHRTLGARALEPKW